MASTTFSGVLEDVIDAGEPLSNEASDLFDALPLERLRSERLVGRVAEAWVNYGGIAD